MIIVDLYSGTFPFGMASTAQDLITEFKEYIKNSNSPSFGKDVPYHRPANISYYCINHVHLITNDQFINYERFKTPPYRRVSDNHLIYARNPENPNHYLLICILSPDAHEQAKDERRMRNLIDICRNHFNVR